MRDNAVLATLFVVSRICFVTVADPICHESVSYSTATFTCSGFSSGEDFAQHIRRPKEDTSIKLILEDSELDHIPVDAFSGLHITSLNLSNFVVASFTPAGGNPFAEVASSLYEILFRRNSSLPPSWSLLGVLAKLHVLRLHSMAELELTPDFNELPKTVTGIWILDSTIARVDENWLSEMHNLRNVIIYNCNLKIIHRSMLPKPALRMVTLVVSVTNLTSIPEDIGEGFPELTILSFDDNRITTMEEKSLAPFQDNANILIGLQGNPLHCDCRIKHLLKFTERQLKAFCKTPAALDGRQVQNLTDGDLQCGNELI